MLPAIPSETDQKEEEEEEEETITEDSKEEDDKETVVIETIKRKIFTGAKAQGVRVRAQPSFAAPAVGLIKPGYVLCYTEEVHHVHVVYRDMFYIYKINGHIHVHKYYNAFM